MWNTSVCRYTRTPGTRSVGWWIWPGVASSLILADGEILCVFVCVCVCLCVQEVHAFWEEVEEELKIRRIRLKELNNKLTATETERTDKVSRLFLVQLEHEPTTSWIVFGCI